MVNIDEGLRAIIQRTNLGPAFSGHLAAGQKVERSREILMPVAIGSEEPNLLKRQAAGVEARLVVLQADMDNHTARPGDKRDMPVKAERFCCPGTGPWALEAAGSFL